MSPLFNPDIAPLKDSFLGRFPVAPFLFTRGFVHSRQVIALFFLSLTYLPPPPPRIINVALTSRPSGFWTLSLELIACFSRLKVLLLAFHLRGVNLSVVSYSDPLGCAVLVIVPGCWLFSLSPQGFFGRPLRGRFSTVLLRRYFTMMLCTVDLGILSSCPMAPSDLPSFQRSTTRCRCTTSCSLVFWQAAVDPPAAPQATPPVAPAAAAAASVGADKRQTVVEARREEQDNVTITGPCGGGILFKPAQWVSEGVY